MTAVKFRAWGPPSEGDPLGKEHWDNPQPQWIAAALVAPGQVQVGDTIHDGATVGDEPGQYRPLRSLTRARRMLIRSLSDTFDAVDGAESKAAGVALRAVLRDNADRDAMAANLMQRIERVADDRKPLLGLALAVVLLADKLTTIDEDE